MTTVRAVVVMGVAGCGKSTVASLLAERLGWELLEGDALHPAANVERMGAGTPLTDEDHAPWLAAIAASFTDKSETKAVIANGIKIKGEKYMTIEASDDSVKAKKVRSPPIHSI